MKLVFFYGPPAAGKLTVATELSRLTGFKLFHNHVSIQFVQSLFDFGTKTFQRLTDKYRLEMLEEAAKHEVDTIFTFVYGKGVDDRFVRKIIRRVRSHGGKVCFVRLYCARRELEKRVKTRARKGLGKITTKKLLDDLFKRHDLWSEIPFQSSLSIDTTSVPPKKVARMVAHHYNLATPKKLRRPNR